MINHTEYVLKNSFHAKDKNLIDNIDFTYECMALDTESCTRKKGDNSGAKIYLWGLTSTRSNKLIYGETFNELFDVFGNLFINHYSKSLKKLSVSRKLKDKVKYIKIPVSVHNLAWDLEFLKYYLLENGYKYKMGVLTQVKSKGAFYNSVEDVEEERSFHIVQNDNVVYGATIYTDYSFKKMIGKKEITFKLCIDLFDSLKIITTELSNFTQYINNIDEVFYKMKEDYDYNSYREDGHIPSTLELRYLYNDCYLLKKGLEDFYIDGLCGGSMPRVGKRTASSIAFDKLKEITWGEEHKEEAYIKYFELDKVTRYETTRKRVELQSYSGGYTHVNHRVINKMINNIAGCSADINSSYPAQMSYKKMPYGKPIRKEYGKKPKFSDEEVFLIEVGFDYVKPKKEKYDLPVFKIGSGNTKTLKELYGDVSAQEYFSTNIKDDGEVLEVFKALEGSSLTTNYNIVITSVEYEFLIKHFDFGYFTNINDDNFFDTYYADKFNGLVIGECLYYKGETGKFKDFIDYFTEMKVKNKKLGNTPLVNQAKLFLNSCYGKFGTRTVKYEKDLIMENGLFTFTSENQLCYEGKEFYRAYASFVTSYGRLQLWNTIIYAVGVKNFLYCDTDSIYCLREEESLKNDMNKIGEYIDSTKLGCWDIETHFNAFKVLGQKKYMYNNIDKDKNGNIKGLSVKCAGLPLEARNIIAKEGFDEFYLGKRVIGKKQKKKVYGGYLLLDSEFTIKKIVW